MEINIYGRKIDLTQVLQQSLIIDGGTESPARVVGLVL